MGGAGAEFQRHEMIMHEQKDQSRQRGLKGSARFFQFFDGDQNFFYMTWDFQASPLILEGAIGTDQESAALDAFDLFAVHDFIFERAAEILAKSNSSKRGSSSSASIP